MTNRIDITKEKGKYKVRFTSASKVHATIENEYTTIGGCYRAIFSHYTMLLKMAGIKVTEAYKNKMRDELILVIGLKQIVIPVNNKTKKIIKQEPLIKKPRVK
jgi:hypothetical protein